MFLPIEGVTEGVGWRSCLVGEVRPVGKVPRQQIYRYISYVRTTGLLSLRHMSVLLWVYTLNSEEENFCFYFTSHIWELEMG